MKFEFTGSNTQDYKILLDGNPITNCQSVDFHIDAQTQVPIVNFNIIPIEGNGIVVNGVDGYITIGDKTYKLTEINLNSQDNKEEK